MNMNNTSQPSANFMFNTDPTQLGHALIIGQTRSGKISHFENDPNYKIIELSEEEQHQIEEK